MLLAAPLFIAVIRWFAPPAGADSETMVFRVHDADDLADALHWPPGHPAVKVIWSYEDDSERGGRPERYPNHFDRRSHRLNGLAEIAYQLPGAQTQYPPHPDVRPWAGRLAVWGRGRLHDEVAELLQSLRTPSPAAAFATVSVGQPAAPSRLGQDAEAKLATVLPEIVLDEVTLQAAIEHLRDATAANIFVDWRTLSSAGIEREHTVSYRGWDLPLARVLDVLLIDAGGENARLGYRVRDGMIWVTTAGALDESDIHVRVYDVRQLVTDIKSSGQSFRGRVFWRRREGYDVKHERMATADAQEEIDDVQDQVSRFIRSSVTPDVWPVRGGPMEITAWAGRLLILHSPEGHREIEQVLAMLATEFAKTPPAQTRPAGPWP